MTVKGGVESWEQDWLRVSSQDSNSGGRLAGCAVALYVSTLTTRLSVLIIQSLSLCLRLVDNINIMAFILHFHLDKWLTFYKMLLTPRASEIHEGWHVYWLARVHLKAAICSNIYNEKRQLFILTGQQ